MKIDFCKDCGDPITFAMNRKKHRVALDPDEAPGGTYVLLEMGRCEAAPPGASVGYVAHSTTCRNKPQKLRKRDRVRSR